ncbi:MAG TPA: CusA/CzcA family heavy metal efflux RND transporter, partial [Bacteroidetes bacterium]|nr:CusA/CzcA family heavy metal efflux RND transporter [Bacteroidota bacterium]
EGRDIKSLVGEIQEKLDKKLELPTGYYLRYGGAFENLERASKRLTLVVPLALALIFILVFFAVKSLKQTLMIYVAIPFAAVGGIFALYFRDMPFSISAGVGFIVLFGVAVLNGLVLISGFNEMKKEGKFHINDIIKKGSIRRIRPILLTASTDILGFLPMAISTSAGAEVQRPLATVVIGGMLTSTILTLIVLPVLYKFVESEKNRRIKTPKLSLVLSSFFVVLLSFIFSQNITAQSIPLSKAIERAKENFPALKLANLEIEKQKALEKTLYELGNTSVYTGNEELGNNSSGVRTLVGLDQPDINIFGIKPKRELLNSQKQRAINGRNLTEKSLIRDVSIAWYNAVYAKKQLQLFEELDTIYADFERSAQLRYKTEASSRIEFLSAAAKHKELLLNLKRAKNDYYSTLVYLNKFLLYPEVMEVSPENEEENLFDSFLDNDMLLNNPELNYFYQNIDVARSKWKYEKSNFLPKLNLGYKWQSIEGSASYHGWEAGISFPLPFLSQKGKTRASEIDINIANQQFKQKELEIKTMYNREIKRYYTLKDVLNYYEQEALPLAEEQIKAANLEYHVGNIDYVQYIQNIDAAIRVRQEFLNQEIEYYILNAQLKYLTGK